MEDRRDCSTCHGTGALADQLGVNLGQCHICGGAGYNVIGSIDSTDIEDKLDDILNKCNDIFEKLNE